MPPNQKNLKFNYLDIYAMYCIYKLKSNSKKLVLELNHLIYTYQRENKKKIDESKIIIILVKVSAQQVKCNYMHMSH